MIRKGFAVLLAALLAGGLAGCMDYRGLSELSIVAGITIDESPDDPSWYIINFEIVDTSAGGEDRGKKTILLEVEGETIFGAIANANEQLARDMYFGNAELLVVHQDVARHSGMLNIIEPFIRDNSVRETMLVVISRDESAKKILETTPEQKKILAYDIAGTLNWQKSGANSTRSRELYQIYDDLRRGVDSISLPAFHLSQKQTSPQPELYGMAVFRNDVVAGYLEDDDVQYFMYLVEPMNQGTFSFFLYDEKRLDTTLTLNSSKPKLGYVIEGDRLVLTAKVKIEAGISGYSPYADTLDDDMVKTIEKEAAKVLNERIRNTVHKMQSKTGADIFGFGKSIYFQDPDYWKSIQDDWSDLFSQAEIRVDTTFEIGKTGSLAQF